MVCAKCQKLNKTTLTTPGVKKKSEMYYGSSASSSGEKKSATLGQNGISKVRIFVFAYNLSFNVVSNDMTLHQSKLLSKAAKNPYAQYASSCTKCKTKVSQGHSLCQTCAYKSDCTCTLTVGGEDSGH